MRPLEILLLALNFMAFLALMVFPLSEARIKKLLALFAAVAGTAQIILEGARWQMVPAYGGAAALFAYFLSTGVWQAKSAQKSRPKSLWWKAARIGVGLAALAFATLLPIAFPVFEFPLPTGPYAIGTLTYHFIDQTRAEIFTADPADRRELMVQIWYPAQPNPSAERVRYLHDGTVLAPIAQLLHLPEFVFSHLKYVATNSIFSAPVADGMPAYPVLVFSHGRGGFRQHNTFQLEELVSHGYIVAAIDHPYTAAGVDFPDGRRAVFDPRMLDRHFIDSVFPFLARDVSFTLDQLAILNSSDPQAILTGRLDLQHLGMFGVSLGGAVTAQACLDDARIKACLPMDVFMPDDVVRLGLRQPTMWMSRDANTMRREGWADADIEETQSTMRAVFNELTGSGYLLLIPGMFHQNFSDFPYFVASPLDKWLGLDGPIDARRGHAIVNTYSLAFFDRHLKTASTPLLYGSTAEYPDVIFEQRK